MQLGKVVGTPDELDPGPVAGAQLGGVAVAQTLHVGDPTQGGCVQFLFGGKTYPLNARTPTAPITASFYFQPSTASAGKVIIGSLRAT